MAIRCIDVLRNGDWKGGVSAPAESNVYVADIRWISSINAWPRACLCPRVLGRSDKSQSSVVSAARRSRRTSNARGQTGHSFCWALSGAERQVGAGSVRFTAKGGCSVLIVLDGRARGIVTRNGVRARSESHLGDAVCWAPGATATSLSVTKPRGPKTTGDLARAQAGARVFANPCLTKIHPTHSVVGRLQSKLTLMAIAAQ